MAMPNHTTPVKTCTRCGKEYPATADNFTRQKAGLYGFTSRCKRCTRELNRLCRERNTSRHELMDTSNLRRICSGCGLEFPLTPDYWHVSKSRTSGYMPHCKNCRKNKRHGAYLRNKEHEDRRNRNYYYANRAKVRHMIDDWMSRNRRKVNDTRRKYRQAHPDQERAKSAAYRERNRDKLAQRRKADREANPEKYRENDRRWYYNNPDARRAKLARRKARLLAAGGNYTVADVCLQVKAQTDKKGVLHCWWCSKPIKGNAYHIDHKTALARGGSNDAGNICISCPTCNCSKGTKSPAEFAGRLL